MANSSPQQLDPTIGFSFTSGDEEDARDGGPPRRRVPMFIDQPVACADCGRPYSTWLAADLCACRAPTLDDEPLPAYLTPPARRETKHWPWAVLMTALALMVWTWEAGGPLAIAGVALYLGTGAWLYPRLFPCSRAASPESPLPSGPSAGGRRAGGG